MVPWVHRTTATTKFEANTCQMKCRAAGFSKTRISELFNLFERVVSINLKLLESRKEMKQNFIAKYRLYTTIE
jgi:hypothetical protein